MSPLKTVEHQPGVMPEIRAAGDSIVYYIDVVRRPKTGRLVLRCDENGDVWAALSGTSRKD